MINLAFKLLNIDSLQLSLNENLKQFSVISEVLKFHGVPFSTWTPSGDRDSPKTFEMAFGLNCKLLDIYLLAYILKDFGLEAIYPSRTTKDAINIGTYMHDIIQENEPHNYPGQYALAAPISVSAFLQVDPKMDTQSVIEEYFADKYTYHPDVEEDYFETDYDEYSDYDDRESYGRYAGSYAQDVEDLSDNFIDDVLDGDPDAYWNID